MLVSPALRTLASAKLAWHVVAQTLAPGAVATTHTRTRTAPDGSAFTQVVTRQPRYLVTNGALITFERLLTMALQQARRVSATPQLWSQVVLTDAGVPELPPLYTSGRELGQKRRLTDRTIRNHVRELKACGAITRYQFRGREHAYCLWINPAYVWETPNTALTTSELAPSDALVQSTNGTNFPLREVLEPLEPLKSAISQVEKLVTREAAAGVDETGTPFTGTAGPPSDCAPAPQASKSGAGAARRERFYQKAHERSESPLQVEKKRYCLAFWAYAKLLIYQGKTFTPEAERLALRAIWTGVFHNFPTGQTEQKRWYRAVERRVELASAWLSRNPSKWPALPFAEVLEGRGYFDAGNRLGFAATAKWLADEHRLVGQGALERAIDEALLELGQRKRLDEGQRRVQASKRAKQKTMSELHRFHHTKLRRMGGDEALQRFAARLQAEHILSLPTPLT